MYTTRKELTREKQKSVFSQNDSQSTEVLFGDKLLALANEVKKKENETKTLHSQYARKITELTNENDMIKSENRKLQSEKLATDRANSENFFKYHQVKNENEVLKRKNDELTSERDSLLSIKSEYDQMTKMFGDFSVQFMETQGFSQSCKICHEIYDTNHHFQVSLKDCGHAFGEECIKKTLEQTGRCPVCNRKKSVADISRVY
ncbi:unnamed protein product [Oikopleura dioica]|uniref:RING-type domain-containing protein n=1 Tax=Oikopleura dioica TaxID=34765 RepID=E4XT68_OIKDI|nr:unnamed protein product [Oikopleura dioica]